jgi:hypothetical protein
MIPHDEPGLPTSDDERLDELASRSIGHVGTSLDPDPLYSNLEYSAV